MSNLRTNFYYCLLLATFALTSCDKKEESKKADPIIVKTLTVGEQGTFTPHELSYSGAISANKSVNITFQVPGTIEEITVSMGDFIHKNDLIARIESTTYQNQYEARKAQAELAKENFERINEVYKKGSIAEIKMIEARSNYKQAESAATAAYQNVKHTKVYAPFSGYVGAKIMEAGDLASPGMPVIQLLDIDMVKAMVTLPDQEVNQYHSGDSARVTIDALGDQSFTGIISEVSVQSDRANPVYTAQIKIQNKDHNIKPGMACEVNLFKNDNNKSEKKTLVIPISSVSVTDDNKNFVYIINTKDSTAHRKYVTTGELYDNGIAIKEGLQPGDQLVTSGYHKLTDKTPVKVIQ
ncbi:efflux RND transporter periplasmic adaptor subunit [Fulvivirga sediminis]|uniref:Efflux RND transporter periplasmic adaptor subunit n=1 Tax=Fulvivirga sediminis TaxID=2803949 RepID=A0A937F8T1_9BACT|nr:efflux RND transporter periplasmic adaptor subunit [Fulvivirga sediminis]MBL3658431.1 efflux RND transporter periplasmic adaptor subunit [Fulvivirga sediminis]